MSCYSEEEIAVVVLDIIRKAPGIRKVYTEGERNRKWYLK